MTWRSVVASFFVILLPLSVAAEITLDDDTVLFSTENDRRSCTDVVSKIAPFEQRLESDSLLSSIPPTLRLNLKRSIIQGVKAAVPPSKKFAVILSYACSKPLLAAETQYECDSSVVVIDAEGCVISRLRGDYLWVMPHEHLPYFALVQDYCCDVQGKATLFDSWGNKVCHGYLGKEPHLLTGTTFSCGTDWRDGKLRDRKDINLEQK
jgi:hypothetical protein